MNGNHRITTRERFAMSRKLAYRNLPQLFLKAREELLCHFRPIISHFGLTEQQTASRVYLVLGDEKFGGHLAFAYTLFIQRTPVLSALGWVLTVPPFCWLGSIGYALVARYRHRLPGGTPACKLPPAG